MYVQRHAHRDPDSAQAPTESLELCSGYCLVNTTPIYAKGPHPRSLFFTQRRRSWLDCGPNFGQHPGVHYSPGRQGHACRRKFCARRGSWPTLFRATCFYLSPTTQQFCCSAISTMMAGLNDEFRSSQAFASLDRNWSASATTSINSPREQPCPSSAMARTGPPTDSVFCQRHFSP